LAEVANRSGRPACTLRCKVADGAPGYGGRVNERRWYALASPCPASRSASRVNARAIRSTRLCPPLPGVASSSSSVALRPSPKSVARSWNGNRPATSTTCPLCS
jgi:hypothetical protein